MRIWSRSGGVCWPNEFVLHYQPRVHMGTRRADQRRGIDSLESSHARAVAAGEFLPVIENHPLIDRIGEWVIDHALTQLERWNAAGLKIPVSVNIAAHHLQQPDFTERLRALLAMHPEISPARLELEVLETSALRDVAQVSGVLAACRDLGVSIALDDFGTGYSSLTYFKRLPVNTLKIDRSFVRDVLDDPEDLSILEGVLGLATAFDRMAIAEGVETADHGRLLLQLGCVYGQGNGIAFPMPGEDLPAWSKVWNPDPMWVNVASVAPRKRSVMHAAVAHRAWVAALEGFLLGTRRLPPTLDPHALPPGALAGQRTQKSNGRQRRVSADRTAAPGNACAGRCGLGLGALGDRSRRYGSGGATTQPARCADRADERAAAGWRRAVGCWAEGGGDRHKAAGGPRPVRRRDS